MMSVRAHTALSPLLLCAGIPSVQHAVGMLAFDELSRLPFSIWASRAPCTPSACGDPSHHEFVHACRGSRVICSSMTRAIAPWTHRGRSPVLAAACRRAQEPRRSSQASAHRYPLVAASLLVFPHVWPLSLRAPMHHAIWRHLVPSIGKSRMFICAAHNN